MARRAKQAVKAFDIAVFLQEGGEAKITRGTADEVADAGMEVRHVGPNAVEVGVGDSSLRTKIASAREANNAVAVICPRWADSIGLGSGDMRGICACCGEGVRFRATSPRKPPKVCTTCLDEAYRAQRSAVMMH